MSFNVKGVNKMIAGYSKGKKIMMGVQVELSKSDIHKRIYLYPGVYRVEEWDKRGLIY